MERFHSLITALVRADIIVSEHRSIVGLNGTHRIGLEKAESALYLVNTKFPDQEITDREATMLVIGAEIAGAQIKVAEEAKEASEQMLRKAEVQRDSALSYDKMAEKARTESKKALKEAARLSGIHNKFRSDPNK